MKHWEELLEGYLNNRLTPAELEAFLQQAGDRSEVISTTIQQLLVSGELSREDDGAIRNQLLDQLMQKIDQPIETSIQQHQRYDGEVRRIPFLRRGWVRAAAVVLLTGSLLALTWFLNSRQQKTMTPEVIAGVQDVPPGREGAILTLSDGKTILLDSLSNGVITTEDHTPITLADGQLSYGAGKDSMSSVRYNTMQTPRGRTFQVKLPDGTQAWLNAYSSITYPTVFNGNERKVAIQGEVYFEVAKNPAKPFRVTVYDHSTIEVLGTHFNVNAYADEPVTTTTLLEGSVRMTSGNAVILKPGEMATLPNTSKSSSSNIKVQTADTNAVMAWKNNRFHFNHADVPTIMRQLARWYDLDIEYEGAIPSGHFNLKPSRNLSASQIQTLLKHIGVNCRIEGRKIIVTE